MKMEIWHRSRDGHGSLLSWLFDKNGDVKKPALMLASTLIVLTCLSVSFALGAIISTDNPDYSPGDIVYLSGTGFNPDSQVDITITRPDNVTHTGSATTDAEGDFVYAYDLDGILGEYRVHATDGTNEADTTFTDARTINSATVDGGTSTLVAPSATVTVEITVQTTGSGVNNDWKSTAYRIEGGSWTCLNTPDYTSTGTYTESFPITAPASLGVYNLGLRAYNDDTCSSGESNSYDMTNAIIVQAGNPALERSCGVDMVLIIDSSGSISSAELTQMKNAFKGFVDAFLPNTPTQIAVVDFDNTATLRQDYTSDITDIKDAIDDASSGGSTNWEDALEEAHDQFDNRADKPDLYIFASDGNPNMYGDGPTPAGEPEAVERAVEDANEIKSYGVRIITLGIGDNLKPANLKAISSDDAYYSSGFDTLADDLAAIAEELCGGTITVRKFVDGSPAEDWEFSASVTGGSADPTSDSTDSDGYVVFNIEIDDTTATVDIKETLKGGYNFVSASCDDGQSKPGDQEVTGIELGQNDVVYCEFNNEGECVPDCSGKECGDDGCGGSCGTCDPNEICNAGVCECVPDCSGKECGDDGCGGSCGTCNDANVCTDDTCDSYTCDYTPNTDPCNDNDACTEKDVCSGGTCSGSPITCNDDNICTDDTCDPKSGCVYTPNTDPCDDNDACTEKDVCSGGTCSGSPITCDDNNVCTDDTCDSQLGCEYTPNTGPCDDNDACTENDVCSNEVCAGTPITCNDNNDCTDDTCDSQKGCVYTLNDKEGPVTSDVAVAPNPNKGIFNVTATTNDSCSPIKRAEYFVGANTITCRTPGTGTPIYPEDDGTFDLDKLIEYLRKDGIIYEHDGSNAVCVQSQDSLDNWGNCACAYFETDRIPPELVYDVCLDDQCPPSEYLVCDDDPTLYVTVCDSESPIQGGEYFLDKWIPPEQIPAPWTGFWLEPLNHYTGGSGWKCSDLSAVVNISDLEDGTHYINQIRGKDILENWGKITNQNFNYSFIKDTTPPVTTKTVDTPKVECPIEIKKLVGNEDCWYITKNTLISLSAEDPDPGDGEFSGNPAYDGWVKIYYRQRWKNNTEDPWEEWGKWTEYTGPFTKAEDSIHEIEWYAVDMCGNEEEHHFEIDIVDTVPPETTKTIVGPQYYDEKTNKTYIDGKTEIQLECKDPEPHPVDDVKIMWRYKVDDGEFTKWATYEGPIKFPEESKHTLEYYCEDALGNKEDVQSEIDYVDHTKPVTTKTYGKPYVTDGVREWINSSTPITLTAEDGTESHDSGVAVTYWRNFVITDPKLADEICGHGMRGLGGENFVPLDPCDPEFYYNYVDPQTPWNIYSGPFYKPEESCHIIEYYSVDNVEKTEDMKWQCVFVENTPPETTKTIVGPQYNEPELGCIASGGTPTTSMCCKSVIAYPDTCATGACGCAPGDSHEVDVCDCPPDTCFNGIECVPEGEYTGTETGKLYIDGVTEIQLECKDPEPHPVDQVKIYWRYFVDDVLVQDWTEYTGPFKFPEESKHTLEYYCEDALGNREEVQMEIDYVDHTKPVTTKTYGLPYKTDGVREWITSQTPVTLTATDGNESHDSGVAVTYWRNFWIEDPRLGDLICGHQEPNGINGAGGFVGDPCNPEFYRMFVDPETPWNVYKGPFYKPEESCHIIEYYSVDNVEKTEDIKWQCVYVDNTPPEGIKTVGDPKIPCEPPNDLGADRIEPDCWWVRDHVTNITLDCVDPLPHPVEQETVCYKVSFDLDPDGYITDDYCKEFGGTMEKDWCCAYVGDAPYTFTFTEDSVHDLEFYCRDHLGNEEGVTDLEYFRVDSVPPNTTKTYLGPYFEEKGVEWIDTASLVNLTAEDGGEICAVDDLTTYYLVTLVKDEMCLETCSPIHDYTDTWSVYSTPFPIAEESCHLIEFYSEDALGNREEIKYQCVFVDKTPPVSRKKVGDPKVPCEYLGEEKEAEECWYMTSDTLITLECTDPDPHPSDHVEIYYRQRWKKNFEDPWEEWGKWVEYTGPFTKAEDSIHELEWYCIDAVEKEEKHRYEIDIVDNQAPRLWKNVGDPKVPCDPEDPTGCDYWVRDHVTPIDLYCDDQSPHPVEGESIWYKILLDGQVLQDWTDPTGVHKQIIFEEDSVHTLEYYCEDALGNSDGTREKPHVQVYKVDSTPPETTKTIGECKYVDGEDLFVSCSTPFTMTAEDGGPICAIGVDEIEYEVEGKHYTYTGPFNLSGNKEGYVGIEYWSNDTLGNEEEHHRQTDVLDCSPPVITEVYPENGTYVCDCIVKFKVTDMGAIPSGVDLESISVSGPTGFDPMEDCKTEDGGISYYCEFQDATCCADGIIDLVITAEDNVCNEGDWGSQYTRDAEIIVVPDDYYIPRRVSDCSCDKQCCGDSPCVGITATVKPAGNFTLTETCRMITFASSIGAIQPPRTVPLDENLQASAIFYSQVAGIAHITATNGCNEGSTDVEVYVCAGNRLDVWAVPDEVPADGESTSTVWVQGQDEFGFPAPSMNGLPVICETDLGLFANGEDEINLVLNSVATATTTISSEVAGLATITCSAGFLEDSDTVLFTGEVCDPDAFNQLEISQGQWQLISVPKLLDPAAFGSVFEIDDILHNYLSGAGWRTWSFANMSAEVEPLLGYWIWSNSNAEVVTLSYLDTTGPGFEPPVLELKAGWNLIGLGDTCPKTIGEALAGLDWVVVHTYNGHWSTMIKGFDDDVEMEPGRGYWVYLNSPGTYVGVL
jgi:hypothetical protein